MIFIECPASDRLSIATKLIKHEENLYLLNLQSLICYKVVKLNIHLLYRDAGISSLAFHPTRRMVVSSSYGGDFKVILIDLYIYC